MGGNSFKTDGPSCANVQFCEVYTHNVRSEHLAHKTGIRVIFQNFKIRFIPTLYCIQFFDQRKLFWTKFFVCFLSVNLRHKFLYEVRTDCDVTENRIFQQVRCKLNLLYGSLRTALESMDVTVFALLNLKHEKDLHDLILKFYIVYTMHLFQDICQKIVPIHIVQE